MEDFTFIPRAVAASRDAGDAWASGGFLPRRRARKGRRGRTMAAGQVFFSALAHEFAFRAENNVPAQADKVRKKNRRTSSCAKLKSQLLPFPSSTNNPTLSLFLRLPTSTKTGCSLPRRSLFHDRILESRSDVVQLRGLFLSVSALETFPMFFSFLDLERAGASIIFVFVLFGPSV
jgi:hypothetical protein